MASESDKRFLETTDHMVGAAKMPMSGRGKGMTGRLSRLMLMLFAGLFTVWGHLVASAQNIPPELLQKALEEKAKQEGSQASVPSPLDLARERAASDNKKGAAGEDGADEEMPPPASPLELDYEMRLSGEFGLMKKDEDEAQVPMLRQYGYEIFRRAPAAKPIIGRLPDSYKLGIGDELVISLVGSINRVVSTNIDREGNVVLPDLPPIPAAGMPLGEFRKLLRERVAATLLGTEAYVSVGDVRQITVTILGEVGSAGLYHVPSLTDLIGALANAGGINRTGSLRHVRIRSGNGGVREIDIYDLIAGKTVDLRIEDGDRIIVPVIGDTVAVAGSVMRPGIYELAQRVKEHPISVADVLELAGNPLRPRGNEIRRYRLDEKGRQKLARVEPKARVSAGDLYVVQPARKMKLGKVELVGHVRQPGERALSATPTVRALLQDGDALKDKPYLPFAVLITEDLQSRQRLYRPINLTPIMAGSEDIALKDRDTLVVFGHEEVSYLSSLAVRATILSPSKANSSCQALRLLARRARQGGSERFAAVLRSVYIGSEKGSGEQEKAAEVASDETLGRGEVIGAARAASECDNLFDQWPDLLPLALEHATVASGAVRRAGPYPLAGKASLRDLIAAAGGLTLSADPRQVEITLFRKASTKTGDTLRRYVDLTHTPMAEVSVMPASIVRFVARPAMSEPGTVLLSGEFRHPGVYAITKGETLLSVIERAGGLTAQAYPFGAVFTRESVKEEQRAGFRRTARELNNALALAALKRDSKGDSLLAAAELVKAVSNTEPVGRIVIEADPAVLRNRPDLDLVLEAGDALFMPKRPNFILVVGDVLNPGALQFEPGKTVEEYIDEAGGTQLTADKGRVFVVYPNGVAQPVRISSWLRESVSIPPGSTIVVPKDVDPLKTLDLVRDITQVLSQLAVSAASIAVISRR